MRKELLLVRVTSNGEVIGHITPAQFRAESHGAPSTAFLPELVTRFNTWKQEIGEPERVEVILNKQAKS